MSDIENNTTSFLRQLPFFAGLNDENLQAFLAAAKIQTYAKRQNLFQQGDPADRFFIIVSGWIKIFRQTVNGEEAVIAMFTRGDIFGEAAIITKAVYPFAAEAAEEAKIVEIPGNVIREQASGNHDIMARIMFSMSKELHNSQMEKEHLSLMTAPQRVGCLLLQLATGMVGKGGTFSFPYDKSLAAARLGMKPETFSRALSQLKDTGVTVIGPEIKIESFSRLVDYCCDHCSSLPGECDAARRDLCMHGDCMGKCEKVSGAP